jgi:hypothetical protein
MSYNETSTVEVTKTPNKYVTVTQKKNVSAVTAPTTKVLEVHDPGVAGPANVLAVGTVTVGSAAVNITGTAPSQTLNFVLPAGASYIHNQSTSAATWTISHNLGFFPSVSVVDNGGNMVIGDVLYITENQVSISFSASFGGKAYFS